MNVRNRNIDPLVVPSTPDQEWKLRPFRARATLQSAELHGQGSAASPIKQRMMKKHCILD